MFKDEECRSNGFVALHLYYIGKDRLCIQRVVALIILGNEGRKKEKDAYNFLDGVHLVKI